MDAAGPGRCPTKEHGRQFDPGKKNQLMPFLRSRSLGALGACLLLSGPAYSDPVGEWSFCGGDRFLPERPGWDQAEAVNRYTVQAIADQADLLLDGLYTLSGDVQVRRGGTDFSSQRVTYDRRTNVLEMSGQARIWDKGLFLSGDKARYEMDSRQGWLEGADYRMGQAHSHGAADRVQVTGSELVQLHGASYTTCDPEHQDWLLEADSIDLNRVEDVGVARHVTLRFKGVPVLYSPWFRFPLSDRRETGFLTPGFGSSNDNGRELTVPFYWNIAPDQDATFGVRAMSRRGYMLQGEYRYLLPNGSGRLNAEYLPDDKAVDDSRGLYTFRHRQWFATRWSTDINLSHVSDSDYFSDLGTSLSVGSERFLERRADLRYGADTWNFLGRVQTYQTIDETIASTAKPYYRLPQLLVQTQRRERNLQLNLSGSAEYVNFERGDGITGQRIDVMPTLSYPWRTSASFLVPRLSLRHTRYDLQDTVPGDPSDPTRTLPLLSVDSGVFLDRGFRLFRHDLIQTLEPRIYYLYVPRRDQDELPVFDTAQYTFSFAQLFREDRFSGADRVGDANQLTLAVTSRLLDAGGAERMRLSVGQIRYFSDRQVTLPGEAVDDANGSDYVAEVAARVARGWQARASLQWDPKDERTDKSTIAVRYTPDGRRILNLAYRFVRDDVEQVDLSGRWPVNRQLSMVGRWDYELPSERILETFAGVEYHSCCWALRFVARHYLSEDQADLADGNADYNNGVFVQFELKGLGGFGRETASFLEQQIPGYENDF